MPPKCASTESATAISHQMLWDVRRYKVKQFECFHFAVKRRWGSHVRIKLFIWIIYSIKPKHMNCEFARMWILYNIRCKNLAKMQAMGQVLDIVGILQLTILHFKAESLIEFNLLCVSNSIVQSMTNIYPAYNNVTRDSWQDACSVTQLSLSGVRDWGGCKHNDVFYRGLNFSTQIQIAGS